MFLIINEFHRKKKLGGLIEIVYASEFPKLNQKCPPICYEKLYRIDNEVN